MRGRWVIVGVAEVSEVATAMSSEFTCSMWYNYTSLTMNAVLRHIGAVHAHQPRFFVICGIHGCSRTYINYHSFRKRIRRKHIDRELEDDCISVVDLPQDVSSLVEGDIFGVSEGEDCESLKRSAVLKSKEVRHISELALNDFIGDVSMIVQQTVDIMALKVSGVLRENGVEVAGLPEIFMDEGLYSTFKDLESSYMQWKAYKSLGFVVSIYSHILSKIITLFGKQLREN